MTKTRARVVELDTELIRDLRRCSRMLGVPFSDYLHCTIRGAIARQVVEADQRASQLRGRFGRRGWWKDC